MARATILLFTYVMMWIFFLNLRRVSLVFLCGVFFCGLRVSRFRRRLLAAFFAFFAGVYAAATAFGGGFSLAFGGRRRRRRRPLSLHPDGRSAWDKH